MTVRSGDSTFQSTSERNEHLQQIVRRVVGRERGRILFFYIMATVDALGGYGQAPGADGVAITDKTCLIMDEVDGMSAGDRGGVGALNALIKKSKVMLLHISV